MGFHSRTLDLIGRPLTNGDSVGLDGLEERLEISLPTSVREWYSVVDGRSLLAEYSNDDQSLPYDQWFLEDIDGKRLVGFLVENQGVCWWGFELDAGDDPPVYVDLDPPPDKLFVYSPTFSEFTYVRVFDHLDWCDSACSSLETYQPLVSDDLVRLRDRFHEEPASRGWPGTDVYRFSDDRGRITIWQSPEQSDWSIAGADQSSFRDLVESVSDVCRRHT